MTADHACTEPDGRVCMVCHGDDPRPGRLPTTYILTDSYLPAKEWCRREGVRIYARNTKFASRGPVLRGARVRKGDRIVFIGLGPSREVLEDMEIAQHELRPEDRPEVEYV